MDFDQLKQILELVRAHRRAASAAGGEVVPYGTDRAALVADGLGAATA